MNEQDLLDLKRLLDEFVRANNIDVDEKWLYNLDDIINRIEDELEEFDNGLED